MTRDALYHSRTACYFVGSKNTSDLFSPTCHAQKWYLNGSMISRVGLKASSFLREVPHAYYLSDLPFSFIFDLGVLRDSAQYLCCLFM